MKTRTDSGFRDWNLKPELLNALDGMGFTQPSLIQAAAIPVALEGKDVLGQAKTGTGKTAAFGIPILQNLHLQEKYVQALVLAPTRELAEQVSEQISAIAKNLKIRVTPIYGGKRFDTQLRALRAGTHIVVGTPGRIMDLMRRGQLDVSKIRFLVLDEADRMLDMGFIEDIDWILERCPPRESRQTMFFSATIPEPIKTLIQRFTEKAVHVRGEVGQRLTVDNVEQVYYSVGRRNKLWALTRVLDHEKPQLTLVFCATKAMTSRLATELSKLGYEAAALHGDLTQSRRDKVLSKFREGKLRILVATDVAARGLDIDNVTHVINYDLPEDPEVYVHRIGRTARMGKQGKAISFVSKVDRKQLELVQVFAGGLIELREPPEPEAKDGASKKPGRERVHRVIDWDHISDRYGNVHIRITIGRQHGVTMTKLHKLIRGAAGIQDYLIGPVHVNEEDSTFTVPKDYAVKTLQGLRRAQYEGQRFDVDIEEQH